MEGAYRPYLEKKTVSNMAGIGIAVCVCVDVTI